MIVHGGTLLKIVSADSFSEQIKCFGKCLFSVWSFWCDHFFNIPRPCIVIALIFIEKTASKVIQDQFLQIVKDHQYE